ncbi:tetratricopeptide repeat protein [Caldimonas thermodepolymerans]|uniref:TPR repeat methyltransferase n=1 Tax=Caldimonas thermodepolymerans TaxID=215580 RepID=A0AA46DH60_9BURK|nr:tetratricopeptide repeat protein [Caldimonas thermodepolymerans]TCP09782.1 putative TPR repeat methyltransferase [Caldimonas thermodepolymerans]UZG49791.1 tetratricopeptide repeat protein [Caldimonas thermodepolymerans]
MGKRARPARASGTDVTPLLHQAVVLHQRGMLEEAERLYRRVLALAPEQPDAHHFLGVLLHQGGRSEQGWPLIERSLALVDRIPDWHNNAGNVLLEMGRLDEAIAAYQRGLLLAPDRPDILNNLGVLMRMRRAYQDSEQAYRRALELAPEFADGWSNLGNLLAGTGRLLEALDAYRTALRHKPGHPEARKMLGVAYYALGQVDKAAEVYRDWLADEPGHPVAQHHLAACLGSGVPERASDAYVETIFDRFAHSFDAKLERLHYRAPQLVAEAVARACGAPAGRLDVLDAGCGTGLCGPLLAPHARRLAGVDLSAQMLAKARLRGVYDELAKAELTAYLQQCHAEWDLVVSVDTLCYFGDLRAVTAAACEALRPGGFLVFTVEALVDGQGSAGFRLNPHGRYSHAAGYVREVLAQAGLAVEAMEGGVLRTENMQPVEGWLVVARRPAAGQDGACAGTAGRGQGS